MFCIGVAHGKWNRRQEDMCYIGGGVVAVKLVLKPNKNYTHKLIVVQSSHI